MSRLMKLEKEFTISLNGIHKLSLKSKILQKDVSTLTAVKLLLDLHTNWNKNLKLIRLNYLC